MSALVRSSGARDIPLFLLAALASAGLLLWAVGDRIFAGAFLAAMLGVGAVLLIPRRGPRAAAVVDEQAGHSDARLLRAALDCAGPNIALALTDAEGRLVVANATWGRWFGGGAAPAELADSPGQNELLTATARAARRDGAASIESVAVNGRRLRGEARAAGTGDHLLWSFAGSDGPD
ncbi:MAG: hypothetical protein ACT4N8_10315, partial [Sphingosinicella sp.]